MAFMRPIRVEANGVLYPSGTYCRRGRADPEAENALYANRETALNFPIVPPSSRNPPSEAVRDDDPLQGALPDAEILLDRGQGDVHDRNIEHDHAHDSTRTIPLLACASVATLDSFLISM